MEPRVDQLVQALFQVAWADGEVTAEEVTALTHMLRGLGLSLSQTICLLDQHLTERPDGELVDLRALFSDRQEQLEVVQALVTLSFADGRLAPEEMGYLEYLITQVGITGEELEVMRAKAVETLAR